MLSLRQEFSVCSSPLLVADGLVFSRRSPEDPTLDICDVQAGGCAASVQFLGHQVEAVDGLCLRGNTLLAHSRRGLAVSFDIEKNHAVHTLVNKLPKDVTTITGVYPTRAADNAFIVTLGANNAVSLLMPSAEVPFSLPFRLDKFPEKSKSLITNVWCHPTKSVCFIFRESGAVQVWSYGGALRSALGRRAGEPETDELADVDEGDTPSAAAAKKVKPSTAFAPLSCLMPPGVGQMTPGDFAVDSFARLFAVVWRDLAAGTCSVVVYDIEHMLKMKPNTQLDFSRLQPVAGALSTALGSRSSSVRFGPVGFHPHEPWLLQCMDYADPGSVVQRSVVCALTLLGPAMDLYRQHPLPYHADSMSICGRSGRLILTSSTGRGRKAVHVYSIMVALPLASQLSVAANVFVVGDGALKSSPDSAPLAGSGVAGAVANRVLQYNPAALCVSPLYSVRTGKDSPFRPVQCTYEMFRMRIGEDITKKAVTPLGVLPMTTTSAMEHNADGSEKWFSVDVEDDVPFDGLFRPIAVRTDVSAQPTSDSATWYSILLGSTMKHIKSKFYLPDFESVNRVQCLGVVRYSAGFDGAMVSNTVFGRYICAMFWNKNAMVATESSSNSILFLCHNGTSLKSLPLLDFGQGLIGGVNVKPNTTFVCSLPKRMSSLWPPECGCPNRIIMATACGFGNECQDIYLSDVGKVDFNLATKDYVTLQPGERVVNCLWQCPPKVSLGGAASNLQVDHQLWVSSKCGLFIGVLTTYRVLIMRSYPSLAICSEAAYGSFAQRQFSCNAVNKSYEFESNCNLNDIPTSICWVGACLVFVSEAGSIDYLLPGSAINPPSGSLMCRAAGLSSTIDFTLGRMCTLPRSRAGSVSLLSVLPDRLLFATNPVDTRVGSVRLSVAVRPVLPLEPLVLGLLAVSRLDNTNKLNNLVAPGLEFLTKRLITTYLPPKPASVGGARSGAMPNTQASLKLAVALSEFGCADLAAVAAGISLSGTEFVGVDFPRYRWIPVGIKFLIALRAGLFHQGVLDLLVSRPELQELIVDPESYGSGALPHPDSTMAAQLAAASRLLLSCGQADIARRTADLSGDDLLLAALLLRSKGINQKAAVASLMEAYKDNRSQKVLQILTILAGSPPTAIRETVLSAVNIGGGNRRNSMLGGVKALSDANVIFEGGGPVNLLEIDKLKASNVDARGGAGLGPVSAFGVLAMDILEEWMGRSRLECVGNRADGGGHIRNPSGAVAAIDSASPRFGGLNKPETWVEDVGHAKADVVGYWRFSDAIMPGDAMFANTGEPNCRINMLDLSRYSNTLELFSDTSDRISFVTSTSDVDPGTQHESVKSLNDAVLKSNASDVSISNKHDWGFRACVGRGSALDVGMFHENEERNKFTFELYISRLQDAAKSGNGTDVHCLAKRCIGQPCASVLENKPMWSITITSKGSLSFTSHCSCVSGASDDTLTTPEGAVSVGSTEDEQRSNWTQIVVTVDSSDSSSAFFTSAAIYIDGSLIKKGKLRLPALGEEDLKFTTLYIAPNLTGWRITELRLWADIKSATNIELQRDNYLPLAEKRKRLIVYKIKGSKKFFSPLRDIVVGEPVAGLVVASSVDGDESTSVIAPDAASSIASKLISSQPSGLLAPAAPTENKTVARRASLVVPPTGGGAMRRGSLLSAPAPTGGILRAPGAIKAVEPAMNRAKVGILETIAGGVSFADEDNADENTNKISEAKATLTIEKEPLAKSSSWKAFDESQSQAAGSSFFSAEASPVVETLSGASVSQEWDAFGTTFSEMKVGDVATASADVVTANSAAEILKQDCTPLNTFGITAPDIAGCIRRSLMQPGGAISTHMKSSCFCAFPNQNDSDTTEPSFKGLKFSLEAGSVICFTDGFLGGLRLAGVFANKKMSIYDISEMVAAESGGDVEVPFSGTLIAEQTMSVPLVYWTFRDKGCILLVTHASIFSWELSPPIGSTHPVKLCDRIDNQDPSKWADRKILYLEWGGLKDMWVVLVSCLRVGVDKKLVSAVQADESCLVTIQHARSLNEKSLVVSARGGCISNNKAILCLQGAADKLICLDLSRTLAPAAGRQSVKTAFDDLEPMVLWSTDLPPSEVTVPGVFPAPGAGIVCLKSGQIGVITANGMTYMCNSLNGQLLVFRQISDSRILSSSSTPANGVVYCLSEKGNIFKLCFK